MKKLILLLVLSVTSVLFSKAQTFVDPNLSNAISTQPASLEVIVTFDHDGAPTAAEVAMLQLLGISQGITLRELPIAGVVATPAQIAQLTNNPGIRSLYLNSELDYELDRATRLTGVDKARTEPVFMSANGGLPISGRGIGVVVNDSGVDGTHPDHKFGQNLVQNVLASANLNAVSGLLPITLVEDVPNTDATGGHGTHVAGIVGGTGAASGGLYEGVAPGADLIGYGSGAGLFILDVLSAFDYAIVNQFRYNIRVVTNSWGTTSDVGTAVNPNDPINVATKACTDRNIVVVFSAGNSGSASGTITGNYKKAPWVICVAAGDKQGRLSDFSSRGIANGGGSFSYRGQTYTWEDRPTVTSPGQAIISTRTVSPIGVLGTPEDIETISPAHLPYYTTLDGTSMAAPHVAGIVALLLEAKPTLSPAQVKQILQATATNIPGRAAWETGAGYVNAYAAIDAAYRNPALYGSTLNKDRTFNATVNAAVSVTPFSVDYTPGGGAANEITFNVANGTTAIEATTEIDGLFGLTGNLVNLVLYSPSGQRYSAGIPVAFTLYMDRGVAVANPEAGTWTLAVEGYQDAAPPEAVTGIIKQSLITGITGLNDAAGHPAESSIRLAVSSKLMDARSNGFAPDAALKRIELADYLLMGQGVRQYLNPNGSINYTDASASQRLLVESVMTQGAALRDRSGFADGLITGPQNGQFKPNAKVNRAEIAYTMVQSLGLQDYAQSLQNEDLTVEALGQTIAIDDQDDVPAHLRGYVQAALNLNLINAYFSLQQGPYDMTPTLHAEFRPNNTVTRADFAVIVTRTFDQWQNPTQSRAQSVSSPVATATVDVNVYPNPASNWLDVQTSAQMQEGLHQLELVNAAGQIVYRNSTFMAPGQSVRLNVSQYPAGTYFLRLMGQDQTPTTTTIVLRR